MRTQSLIALVLSLAASLACGDTVTSKSVADAAKKQALVEQAEAEKAKRRVMAAAEQIRKLEADLKDVVASLAAYEAEFIAKHPDNSRLKEAIVEEEQAEAKYLEAQRQVLASPAYKAAYATAQSSADKLTELPLVRKQFLEADQAAREAEYQWAAARKRLEMARQEVLQKDLRWLSAVTQVRMVKEQLLAAKGELERGKLNSAASVASFNNALKLAKHAAIAAERAEILKRFLQKQKKSSAKKAKPKKGSYRR